MWTLLLPYPPRPATLRGFCLVAATGLSLLALLTAAVFDDRRIALLGTGIAAVCFAIGMIRPRLVRLPYAAWNRCARIVSRGISAQTTALCFHLVVRAAGMAGSRAGFVGVPGRSLWRPRPADPGVRRHASYAEHGIGPSEGLVRAYWTWLRSSGQLWAVCLLPYLVILALTEEERTVEIPDNVYTLY